MNWLICYCLFVRTKGVWDNSAVEFSFQNRPLKRENSKWEMRVYWNMYNLYVLSEKWVKNHGSKKDLFQSSFEILGISQLNRNWSLENRKTGKWTQIKKQNRSLELKLRNFSFIWWWTWAWAWTCTCIRYRIVWMNYYFLELVNTSNSAIDCITVKWAGKYRCSGEGKCEMKRKLSTFENVQFQFQFGNVIDGIEPFWAECKMAK